MNLRWLSRNHPILKYILFPKQSRAFLSHLHSTPTIALPPLAGGRGCAICTISILGLFSLSLTPQASRIRTRCYLSFYASSTRTHNCIQQTERQCVGGKSTYYAEKQVKIFQDCTAPGQFYLHMERTACGKLRSHSNLACPQHAWVSSFPVGYLPTRTVGRRAGEMRLLRKWEIINKWLKAFRELKKRKQRQYAYGWCRETNKHILPKG